MRLLPRLLKWILILTVAAAGAALVIGMALPRSHEASRAARIDAPRSSIYTILITPETYPDWRPDVERVERLDSDRFREHGANGPMILKFVQRDEPSRLVVAVDDPDQPFSGTWTIELQPEGLQGEWTRVTITERGEVPNPIFRVMARIMMAPAESIDQYLENLGARFDQTVTIEPGRSDRSSSQRR